MISSNREISARSLASEFAQRNPLGWHGTERELVSAYFGEAMLLINTPVALDFQWAITRLGQLATAREQDRLAMEILAALHGPLAGDADGRDPFEVKQEQISNYLARIGQSAGLRLGRIKSLVEIIDDGVETGAVPSGLGGLDYVMSIGGIPKGQLTVVRAHHKGGKSLLMRSMFYRDICTGIKSLYVTFADITEVQLKRLLIQADTGKRKPPLGTLADNKDYYDSVAYFNNTYSQFGFTYDAFGASDDTSIEDVTEAIKSFHKEHKFEKIYLDYAQKISSRDPKARAGSVAEFDVVCRKLANFFHHLGVACVVGSQTTAANKASGERAKTKLGRRLEEEAGLVLHVYKDVHKIEVEVVYNRWGESSVDGGKKLVIGGLYHSFEHHIITGEGLAEWKDGDMSEPYIKRE